MHKNIALGCKETGERLYITSKNRKNPEQMVLKKYFPKLRRKENFVEVK